MEKIFLEEVESPRLHYGDKKMHFASVISPFRDEYNDVIYKVTGKNNNNINATAVIEGINVNLYNNGAWNTFFGVTYDDEINHLIFGPSDFGSASYFRDDANRNTRNMPLESMMDDMAKWVKGFYSPNDAKFSYRRVRLKPTMAATFRKLKEIDLRRRGEIKDESNTIYLDKNGNQIKSGSKERFTNKKANFHSNTNIPVAKNELRHNEVHLRAILPNIENIFVTKEDFEGKLIYRKDGNIYNSKEVLILSALKKLDQINHERKEVAEEKNPQLMKDFIDFEIQKVQFLIRRIKFFSEKLYEYQRNLDALNEVDYNSDKESEDLRLALKSKIRKNNNFPKHHDNITTWLNSNIEKLELLINDSKRELTYYNNLYGTYEVKNEYEIRNDIKNHLIKKLQNPVKFCIYDKSQGRHINLEDYDKTQSVARLKAEAINDLLNKHPKDESFLAQLVINGFSHYELDEFFFNNPLISRKLKNENLNFHSKNGNILYLAHCYNKAVVPLLNNKGLNINFQDSEGFTSLHFAASKECFDLAKSFIDNGADVTKRTKERGSLPLHLAAVKGNIELVKLFLQNGNNINDQDKEGWTSLHIASEENKQKMVEFLVEKGGDVDRAGNKGKSDTPLNIAIQSGHCNLVSFLLQVGADSNKGKSSASTISSLRLAASCYKKLKEDYSKKLEKSGSQKLAASSTIIELLVAYGASLKISTITPFFSSNGLEFIKPYQDVEQIVKKIITPKVSCIGEVSEFTLQQYNLLKSRYGENTLNVTLSNLLLNGNSSLIKRVEERVVDIVSDSVFKSYRLNLRKKLFPDKISISQDELETPPSSVKNSKVSPLSGSVSPSAVHFLNDSLGL